MIEYDEEELERERKRILWWIQNETVENVIDTLAKQAIQIKELEEVVKHE